MDGLYVTNLRERSKFSKGEFAKALGIDVKTLYNWEHGGKIPATKEGIILDFERNMRDEPPSLTKKDDTDDKKAAFTLPLIPIAAMAGKSLWDSEGVVLSNCKRYSVPELYGTGAEFLICASGDSMLPKIHDGDILACKWIRDILFWQAGRAYVLDTTQGGMVKVLFECHEDNDYLICHSYNTDNYPDFRIPKSEIRSVAIVVASLKITNF